MTTPRTAYKLDTSNHGSDLAGETAAAMAAAAIAFRPYNSSYSDLLLVHSKQVKFLIFTSSIYGLFILQFFSVRYLRFEFLQLFSFADRFRGLFVDSIPNTKKFYASSGYEVS